MRLTDFYNHVFPIKTDEDKQLESISFYDKNIEWVDKACRDRYRSDWQTLARQWGESDNQGMYQQFYFFVDKLKYHLNKPAIAKS